MTHLGVADQTGHAREDRHLALQGRVGLEVAVPGEGADGNVITGVTNVGQLAHPADIDDPVTHSSFDFLVNVKPDPTVEWLMGTGNFAGESEETALAVLEETDASAFSFETGAIGWRDKRVTTDQILASRAEFAIAFGSCSFREPVDELANLTRSARATDT